MLKRIALIAFVVVLLIAGGCVPVPPAEEKVVVGMMTIVSHPSLDKIQQGVKDRLQEAGFIEGQNLMLLEGNAEGDMATLSTIAQRFVDEGVDLIVATTTPAAQAAFNATKDAGGPPIIYNGVSNPFIAGLAEAPDKHPAWMVGNQLLDPVEESMGLIEQLVPNVKAIGLVHNPAEANAAYLVEVAQATAEKMGVTLEIGSVSNSSEIQTAAEALVARGIDAFLAINDNTVTSGFSALVQVANDNDLPLVGTSASMPPMGAVASYGIDPYQEGLDSGDMVVAFLKGEFDIATAGIQVQKAVLLSVNPAAAAEQGVTLPQDLVDQADTVIE